MLCPHCKEQHPIGMRYCPNTGKPVELTMITCPNCRRPLLPGSHYCQSCGAPVVSKNTVQLPDEQKAAAPPETPSGPAAEDRPISKGLATEEITPPSRKRPIWIILGVLSVVVILVIVAITLRSIYPASIPLVENPTVTSTSTIELVTPSVAAATNPPVDTPTSMAAPASSPTSASIALPALTDTPTSTPAPAATASPTILPTPHVPYDLAFVSNRDGMFSIYVMDAHNPQEWLSLAMPDGYDAAYWPTYCGEQIAFEAHDRSFTQPRWIYLTDLASQALEAFIPPGEIPDRTGLPGCSWDGRYIAYSAYRDFDWSLNVVDFLQDQKILNIPEGDYPMLGYPKWSLANDMLVWMGIRVGGTFDANQTLELGSAGAHTELMAKGKYPALSPDGTQLAYICGNLYKLCIAEWPSGNITHEQTINYTKPFNGEMAPASAAWSTDGQWIYFTSSVSGNWDIYRMHPDGSGLQNMTEGWTSDELMPAAH